MDDDIVWQQNNGIEFGLLFTADLCEYNFGANPVDKYNDT